MTCNKLILIAYSSPAYTQQLAAILMRSPACTCLLMLEIQALLLKAVDEAKLMGSATHQQYQAQMQG